MRLLKAFPALRAVVNSILLAVTNVIHLFFLIALVNFLIASIGMLLFRTNDPQNFGSLNASLMTIWMVSARARERARPPHPPHRPPRASGFV